MREIIKETKKEIDDFLKEQSSQDVRLLRAQSNLGFLLKEFERLIDNFFKNSSKPN